MVTPKKIGVIDDLAWIISLVLIHSTTTIPIGTHNVNTTPVYNDCIVAMAGDDNIDKLYYFTHTCTCLHHLAAGYTSQFQQSNYEIFFSLTDKAKISHLIIEIIISVYSKAGGKVGDCPPPPVACEA